MGSTAVLLLRLFSRLPLSFNHWVGRCLGALVWRFGKRERQVALANLQFCFPDSDREWRQRIARQSIMSMGEAMLEAPRLWHLSSEQLMRRLENPDVLEEILAVYRQGKGLVIASPHLGSWEYAGLLFAAHTAMISLFRPPKHERAGDYIKKARQRTGGVLVPTDGSGIRALSRALIRGDCMGMLPDQEPSRGNGVYADFFGRPAYTMFLLPRLVQKRRPPVFFVFSERLAGGRFRLHSLRAEEALYSADPATACAALNRSVETLIRLRIDQYNWNYKRFLAQPDGSDIYKQGNDSPESEV